MTKLKVIPKFLLDSNTAVEIWKISLLTSGKLFFKKILGTEGWLCLILKKGGSVTNRKETQSLQNSHLMKFPTKQNKTLLSIKLTHFHLVQNKKQNYL